MERQAVGYLRVSSARQVQDGISLGAQELEIRRYAERKGLRLVGIERDEGVSGSKRNRPGLDRLCDRLRAEAVTEVVVYRLDRIGRALWAIDLVEGWDRRGIAVHCLGEGDGPIDASTAAGRLTLTIKLAVARHERDVVAERTRWAMRRLREMGRKTGGADAPFGFAVSEDGLHLEPDPVEQECISIIRELESRGWSRRRIAAHLDALEMKTKRGGRWHPMQVSRVLQRERRVA